MRSTVGNYRTENIVTRGLVLHLDAGNPNSYYGPSNSTVWKDLSGNANNGTLVNGVGYNDGAFVFDGVNDAFYGPININDLNITAEITMEAWVNNNGTGNGDRFIIINKENSFEMGINSSNGSLQWAIFSTVQSWSWLGSSGDLRDNAWHHVVVTRSNSALEKSYVDSSLNSVVQRNGGNIITRNNRLNIAGRGGGITPTSNFGNNISNIRIYNRALTPSEISQNFNAQRSRFGI